MNKKAVIFFIFTMLVSLLSGNELIDSLELQLEKVNNKEKIILLKELAEKYLADDPRKSIDFSQQILSLINEDNRDKVIIYNILGEAYENLDDHDNAIHYYKLTVDSSRNVKDNEAKAYALYSLAIIYDDTGVHDKAIIYYSQAAALYQKLDQKGIQANILNNIGLIYEGISVYDKALEYYLQAYDSYRKVDDIEGIGHALNNIGNIYQTIGNFFKALDYYQQSLQNYEKINNESGISSSYNNIGIIYDELQDYDKALEYYQHSLEIAEKIGEIDGIATSLNNIGIIYHTLENKEKALECYFESLDYSEILEDYWAIANTNSNIGELYIEERDFTIGLDYLDKAFTMAQEHNFRDIMMECYKIYRKYFVAVSDYENAYLQALKFEQLRDSLFSESSKRIAEIQTVYETEKKEQEIDYILLANRHQRAIKLFFIAFSVLLLIVSLWLYRLYRHKNREIETRKRLEQDLLRLAYVVNQTGESILITDLLGKIIYVNPSQEKNSGYNSDHFLGKNLSVSGTGFQENDLVVNILQLLTTGESWQGTVINTSKNKVNYYETVNAFPIKDQSGVIINFAIIKHDITKIIQAEEELRTSEERFRRMAENVNDGLSIIEDGKVVYVNDKLCDITGYTREEMLDLNGMDLAAPFEKVKIRRILNEVSGSIDTISNFEYWLQRKDGEIRYIRNSYSIFKKDDKIINRYIITSDITDRKKAEEKILKSLKEKDILLKEINHRVKNNMQIITSLLKLQAGYIKDEAVKMLFQNCQNRVKSMSLIHEKLYQSDDLTNVDFSSYVNNLTRHLITSYHYHADQISVRVNVSNIFLGVNKAIPCGIIINELFTNSLKYGFAGIEAKEVSITLKNQNDIYILTVSDNGIGIPEEIDFRNTNSLGLQLVNSLTEQLHGKIELLRNNGTTFIIEFP
ncbi:MAG: tetratricopeptide repeat protein [Candidatus Cloacimonetes bacterium]|nr:tetratricopeptide repeat protein [Candidatus Cloacimonadota bacterium]